MFRKAPLHSPGERDFQETKLGLDFALEGYICNPYWHKLSLLFGILSLGLLPLFFFWHPEWKLKFTHDRTSLAFAEELLITDVYGQKWVEKILILEMKIRYFEHKKIVYIWQEPEEIFAQLEAFADGTTCSKLRQESNGLALEKYASRFLVFGPNVIHVPIKTILYLIFNEALNPFYIFQLFACIVWALEDYIFFTFMVIVLSTASVAVNVHEMHKQDKALHDQVKSVSQVKVLRNKDEWNKIPSSDLVPGDVIQVPYNGSCMECDGVLLSGSVVVNESVLTGESVPITKVELPESSDAYSIDDHKRHTLFCGTKILQTQDRRNAVSTILVTRTGFATCKGELVRSIMFPKPVDMKFYRDGMRMIFASFMLGLMAAIFTAKSYIDAGSPLIDVILNTLDILTIVVPPSLPVCMTVGNICAQRRLKSSGIYCLSSKYINMAGSVNLAAFDKTGTLTEESLDLQGVIPAENGIFTDEVSNPSHIPRPLLIAMANCHSLVFLDQELSGDPLDMITFKSTGWVIYYEKKNTTFLISHPRISSPACKDAGEDKYATVHQFPFMSSLQRMSVLVQSASMGITLLSKGAPETIASLCDPKTLPRDFQTELTSFTTKGYRVLAFASKQIKDEINPNGLHLLNRESLEKNMIFLGLMVLQNSLKPQTKEQLRILHKANIRTLMVTGDNLMTAIETACECGMVETAQDLYIVRALETKQGERPNFSVHLNETKQRFIQHFDEDDVLDTLVNEEKFLVAMDGNTFSLLRKWDIPLFHQFVQRGIVFARMLPDLKVQLIEVLQDIGYVVSMCGDGANDCGALKTANIGVSLSTAEASVAAPFTSSTTDISCVTMLIREGRCALVTSFGLFKHFLSFAWSNCFGVLVLYSIGLDFTDLQYVYMDGLASLVPAVLFSRVSAHSKLSKTAPPTHLFGIVPLLSLFLYLGLNACLYMVVWIMINHQPWLVSWKVGDDLECPENLIMFSCMSFCVLLSPIVFSQGAPYRKMCITNYWFIASECLLLMLSSVLLFYPPKVLADLFSISTVPSYNFLIVIFLLIIMMFLLALLIEDYLLNNFLHKKFIPWMKNLIGHHKEYQLLEGTPLNMTEIL